MAEKLAQWISAKLLLPKAPRVVFKFFFFALIITPIITMALIGFFTADKLTKNTVQRDKEAQADLAAQFIQERLDRVVDLSITIADHHTLRDNIQNKKWGEAIDMIHTLPKNLTFVERIAVIDMDGTLMATSPDYPGLVGTNFSHRDWYKGVIRNNGPYVSEVFKSATVNNSIVVTTPIKSLTNENENIGLLNIQISTDTLYDWVKTIKSGTNGVAYIVDQRGHLAPHPKNFPQDAILDLSQDHEISAILNGQNGFTTEDAHHAEIIGENVPHISAYRTIQKYGWGVVISQPIKDAYLQRKQANQTITLLFSTILFLTIFGIYMILHILELLNLRNQREKTLLKSIGDGIIAIDRFWNITMWNKAAEIITGWTEAETMGKPLKQFFKLIREKDRQENLTFIEKAMVSGKVGFLENHTLLIRKDSSEIPVGDSAAPIFDNEGLVIGAVIIFRDATKEKESGMIKSDFAYASHQLNTPVTKALWLLEAARDETDPSKIKNDVETAYKATLSIQKLSTELLVVSEIDQKIIIPKLEDIKLSKIFDDILKECKMSGGTAIEISPISVTASIKTDLKIIKYALLEIIDNALKYNKKDGRIAIKVNIEEKNLFITIEDSGISIPAEQQSLIFTKFFRGNNFDTTEIAGGGLGLFIAKEYIKLLNGRVWFQSEKDKGTTFFVQIPLK